MTGAKNLMGSEADRELQFKIGSNPKQVTNVKITLGTDDLYTVTTYRIVRNYTVTTLAERTMVYAEDLRRVFEAETGLRTSL